MTKLKAFSEFSEDVRSRPGGADEVDARKRAIVATVRDDVVSLGPVGKDRSEVPALPPLDTCSLHDCGTAALRAI